MAKSMTDWITTGERELPPFVLTFAKPASGSSSEEDDDDDDEDDEEDDDDDDDDLASMSEEDLRAALKATKKSLSIASGSSKTKRDRIKKLNRELEEARAPKPKPPKKKADDDDDGPDLDTIRHEAKSEGEKAGIARAKKAEAKSSLLAAGVNPERVAKAVGLINLDELDLDDDGLDGIDDEIEELRKGWPELFAKKRTRRQSVSGDRDADGDRAKDRGKPKTASEKAAAQLLSRN